jgi:hypothetical protein
MNEGARRPGPVVLIIGCALVGLALIAVGVYTRDSIGYFTSWLVVSVGMLVAIVPSVLWRRNRDRQQK